jgi:NAD(P)-dependent dehydrogenase (short-subunit alcohol dehydrogenase family)
MNLEKLQSFYDFTNHTILITGGAGVLGMEISRTLVECNATVIILSRNQERTTAAIAEINKDIKSKGRAVYVHGDVMERDTLLEANETIRAKFGTLDILINGAGGNHPSGTTSADVSFFDLPLDALRHINDLNLLGTILPCQVFGRGMADRGEGVILNVSSMNAFRPLTRIPAYSAAKAAINNFTQWLAVHMAQNYSPRIRVNAIAPGFFITEQNRFLLTDKDSGDFTERGKSVIAHTPMNRFGTPEDLIGATLWLISPAAAFVTGVVIPVDGGFSAFSGV